MTGPTEPTTDPVTSDDLFPMSDDTVIDQDITETDTEGSSEDEEGNRFVNP